MCVLVKHWDQAGNLQKNKAKSIFPQYQMRERRIIQ